MGKRKSGAENRDTIYISYFSAGELISLYNKSDAMKFVLVFGWNQAIW